MADESTNQNPVVDTHPTASTVLALLGNNVQAMQSDLKEVRGDIKEMRTQMSNSYVSKEDFKTLIENRIVPLEQQRAALVSKVEFDPVKNVVFGLVGMILVSVVGALIALVVMK